MLLSFKVGGMWSALLILLGLLLVSLAWVGLFFPRLFRNRKNPEKSYGRKQLFGNFIGWGIASLVVAMFVAPGGSDSMGEASMEAQDRGEIQQITDKVKTNVVQPISYTVLEDEPLGRIRRSVELLLPERIEPADLERLAYEIRDGDPTKYERTFIGWRVEGDDLEGMYWASTHFDPNLDVQIIGPTAAEYAYLRDLNPVVPGVELGRWIETGMGRYSHLLVGYKTGGKTYFHMYMLDGDDKATEYIEERFAGEVRYRRGADERDYMVINDGGELVFGDEEGVVRVLGE